MQHLEEERIYLNNMEITKYGILNQQKLKIKLKACDSSLSVIFHAPVKSSPFSAYFGNGSFEFLFAELPFDVLACVVSCADVSEVVFCCTGADEPLSPHPEKAAAVTAMSKSEMIFAYIFFIILISHINSIT